MKACNRIRGNYSRFLVVVRFVTAFSACAVDQLHPQPRLVLCGPSVRAKLTRTIIKYRRGLSSGIPPTADGYRHHHHDECRGVHRCTAAVPLAHGPAVEPHRPDPLLRESPRYPSSQRETRREKESSPLLIYPIYSSSTMLATSPVSAAHAACSTT